jgi:hypothetical protein
MSLGAASTSMGVVIVWRNYIFISTNFCYSGTLFYVVTNEKHYPEFEHIEEYEKVK